MKRIQSHKGVVGTIVVNAEGTCVRIMLQSTRGGDFHRVLDFRHSDKVNAWQYDDGSVRRFDKSVVGQGSLRRARLGSDQWLNIPAHP